MADLQLLIEDWGVSSSDTSGEAPLVEAKLPEKKGGDLYIEGIFMQSNVVNRNGRRYPKKVMENAVSKYMQEQVNTNQALGELNHPQRSNVDPAEAAIRITELHWDGDNVLGKAIVLNTPKGQIVRALIEGGWVPGVSSRGLGSVKQVDGINEVQDFRLTVGVDVVWGPSAPSAYVKPVTESNATAKTVKTEEITESNDADFTKLAETLKTLL
ncbi:prohead core protein serine protease [Vibrio phage 1.081.O._10N.286.52.C2]|nr:prohead core protein serine protease [Vibrio phage 1.081.O._10N.286.52.C2]